MKTVLSRLAVVVLAAAMLFAFACGGDDDDGETASATVPTSAAETATSTPTDGATATATGTPSPTPTPFAGAVATLEIPRFDVSSSVESLGLIPGSNQLDTPHNPLNTGWYAEYGRPGWGGNSVFSAHVDYYPNIIGPFNKLSQLEAGDKIIVTMEDGTKYTYEVFSNRQFPVDTIPMGELIWPEDLKPADEEWITLITCGGDFRPYNGVSGPGEYLHREVVIAKRVDA
jgi:sortase (surface protein transpeptidase)